MTFVGFPACTAHDLQGLEKTLRARVLLTRFSIVNVRQNIFHNCSKKIENLWSYVKANEKNYKIDDKSNDFRRSKVEK